MTGRRLLVLVIVLAAIGIPAAVLEAACVGRACDADRAAANRVPFCPLPARLRALLVNGFREGRSPDVLGVAMTDPGVFTEPARTSLREPWPASGADERVPIVFSGTGVDAGAEVSDGTTLDRIAPTVAEILGFDRPFPKVRSGIALEDVADGIRPRLVVLIAWKGAGTADVEGASVPTLSSQLRHGAGTRAGSTGSLPLDPTATLTTIGTGGLPSQHGMTGTFVRGDDGTVVRAFSGGEPTSVIATLADDLDAPDSAGGPSPFEQGPVIVLVATQAEDRGLIGDGWYEGHDEDLVELARGDAAVSVAREHLRAMGTDAAPDVLGVVLEGRVEVMDRRTGEIAAAAEAASGGSALVVVAGTGTAERGVLAEPDDAIVAAVERAVPGSAPAVDATVAGGVYLDQAVLREAEVTGQMAVDALLSVTSADGEDMMADAFQGFAVSFARYC